MVGKTEQPLPRRNGEGARHRVGRAEKKSNPGRKAACALPGASYQLPKTLTLDLQTVETLERLGNGNLSAGARKAAAIVKSIKSGLD